MLTGITIIC